MSLPIRILLIEDEPASVDDLEKACRDVTAEIAIVVASTVSEALEALDSADFDLIVCDLGLPDYASGAGGRTESGLLVFERIQNVCGGTPVMVFSGRATPRIVGQFLQVGRQADIFGTGPRPMVQFFPKDELPACAAALSSFLTEAVETARLVVRPTGSLELSVSEQRVLQNIARRLGGTSVEATAFGGGLSGSKTLRVTVQRANGSNAGQLVAKLNSRGRVLIEAQKVLGVTTELAVGGSASLIHTVDAGAGGRGGAFYQFANEHDRSLFDVLAGDAEAASAVVATLHEKFKTTTLNAPQRNRRFKELRRPLISDLELLQIGPLTDSVAHLAEHQVLVAECTQHADFHGFNVLVDRLDSPAVIDFGDVRLAPASLDPITLELSWVFHPDSPRSDPWPTPDQLSNWFDLKTYVETSPIAPYIRACRRWAVEVAASEQEIAAVVLAYALRQLKYGNPTEPHAVALATAALSRLPAL